MDIKFASMYQYDEKREERIVMKCERHSSQVSNIGNCVDDTPAETGLR